MLDVLRFNSISHRARNAIRRKQLLEFDQVSHLETEAASLINRLIKLRGKTCEDYLEIGVEFGRTLQAVRAERIWGVDPAPLFLQKSAVGRLNLRKTTSDDFFSSLPPSQTFDLIFLDGLHEANQTYRDFLNSLKRIKPDGFIVIDDVLPVDDLSAHPNMWKSIRQRRKLGKIEMAWHGDVYRVVMEIARSHQNLGLYIIADEQYKNGRAVVWNFSGSSIGDSTTLSSDSVSQVAYASFLNQRKLKGDWSTFEQLLLDSRKRF